MDILIQQFIQGVRPQSRSIDTLAYALAQPDPKLVTVTAELLYAAFRSPLEEEDPKAISRKTALSLVGVLAQLPGPQAVDASPAIVFAAMQANLEKQLYRAVESHSYKPLASRTYKYLMAAGGMRTWGKVQELGQSPHLETVLAALDAPRLMQRKTSQDQEQICGWYLTMASDQRAMVAVRAKSYLVTCGPVYVEKVLAADEVRIKDKTITRVALDSYQRMCVPDSVMQSPTPEQCTRLKEMLMAILESVRFEGSVRAKALEYLTSNFPGSDMLKLARHYVHDQDVWLATRARATMQGDLAMQVGRGHIADHPAQASRPGLGPRN